MSEPLNQVVSPGVFLVHGVQIVLGPFTDRQVQLQWKSFIHLFSVNPDVCERILQVSSGHDVLRCLGQDMSVSLAD